MLIKENFNEVFMAETTHSNGKWNIALARTDLIEKAGLNEEDITLETAHLKYKGRRMRLSHDYGKYLVVSLEGKDDEDFRRVVDSFTKVMEYFPFCRYDLNLGGEGTSNFPTYEWDRINPNARFSELEAKTNVSNLRRV